MRTYISLAPIVAVASFLDWLCAKEWGWPHVIAWGFQGAVLGVGLVYVAARRKGSA